MSTGVFVEAHNIIMDGITSALGGQSGDYGGLVAPTIVAWMSLYVLISGYKALAGKLQTPLPDVVWNLGVCGVLLAFVTNASGWLDLVNSAIDGIRTGLSGTDSGIWGKLDSLWDGTQTLAEDLMKQDDSFIIPIDGLIAKVLVWTATGIIAFTGAIVNLSAEITLKLLIATGPLFVACLAWGWFRSMFENWMKAIMSCLITVLFSSISLNMVLNLMNHTLTLAEQSVDSQGNNIVTTSVMIFGVGLLGATVTMLSAKIATSLSGSAVSTAVAGTAMAAGAGAALLGAKAAPSVAKGAYNAAGKAGDKMGDAANWALNKGGQAYDRYKMQQDLRKASIERMKKLNK